MRPFLEQALPTLGLGLFLACAPSLHDSASTARPASASASQPAVPHAAEPKAAPHVIYLRGGALFAPPHVTIDRPLPDTYVTIQSGNAPESLMELLRNKTTIFMRALDEPSCVAWDFEWVAVTRANIHQDRVVGSCQVRETYELQFSPGRWGDAMIDQHFKLRKKLRGCEGIGFGIALCGEPTFHLLEANERRVKVIEARGHLGKMTHAYAYYVPAAVDWFFDRTDCEKTECNRQSASSCSD